MNRVKEVERINAKDLQTQIRANQHATTGDAGRWDVDRSWHAQYKHSAYVYAGGLPYDLSEGDIIVIFSQFGEIVDVNLPRDKDTGKPKGFAFICYEDQRSTVLAVDNFNGAKVLGRTIRCDHCESYKEEQKKDVANLPEHLLKKLSDKELAQKKEDFEKRNAELDAAAAAKEELFAEARGTAETERQKDEREIREQILTKKDQEANSKRNAHIEAVLARRRGDYQHEAAEDARRQQEREERRKKRVEEERRRAAEQLREETAALAAAKATATTTAASRATTHDSASASGMPVVSDSKWERLMGGAHKKKKKKKRHRSELEDEGEVGAAEAERKSRRAEDEAPAGGPRKDGEAISVDETNKLRESLGLKPLRE